MGIATSGIRTGLLQAGARHRHPLVIWMAVTLLAAAGFLLLPAWTPSDAPQASICLWRRLGFACPTCGMTRALAWLAKGEWRAAWIAHPLAPFLAAEAVAAWLVSGVLIAARRWRAPSWRAVNIAVIANAVLFLAVWIVRTF